jgi:curli production assembly/transport component CsgG
MNKTIISLAVATLVLTGCATGSAIKQKITGEQFEAPVIEQSTFFAKSENTILPPKGGPIPIAVYSFRDMTGQRKSMPNIASLSSAVTQGGDAYLIKALQDVGDQRWFTVLERVGLENLIKERQMIRQMREQYQGKDAKPLPPMMFAGIIIEGAIVGYDSNTLTGGSGVRLLGIGAQTQYQSDTVTVTLRTVSVATGEVLTTTTVTKTVLSYMDKFGVLKFVSEGEKAIEAETGASINESINKATNLAIQAAVVGTIREGVRKGHWSFKEPEAPKVEAPKVEAPKVEAPKVEAPKEEKKDELVQKNAPQTGSSEAKASSTENKPSDGKVVGRDKEQPTVTDTKKTVTSKGRSNVRENIKSGSTIIAILEPGQVAQVLKDEFGLFYVELANGKKGWISKDIVK